MKSPPVRATASQGRMSARAAIAQQRAGASAVQLQQSLRRLPALPGFGNTMDFDLNLIIRTRAQPEQRRHRPLEPA